jgi:hypothetical protein
VIISCVSEMISSFALLSSVSKTPPDIGDRV